MATDKGNKKSSDIVKKLGDDVIYVKTADGQLKPLKTDQMDEDTLQKTRDMVAEAGDVMQSIQSSKGDVLEPAPSNDVETPSEQATDPNESMETNEPPAPAASAEEASALAEAEAKNPDPFVEGLKEGVKQVPGAILSALDSPLARKAVDGIAATLPIVGNPMGAAVQAATNFADPGKNTPYPNKEAPGTPPAAAAQPPPPAVGVSASVSGSGPRPNFGTPPMQKVHDYSTEARVAMEEALNGQVAVEQAKGQAQAELAKVYLQRQAVDAQYAADTMTANSIRQERAEQFQKSQRDLLAEISKTDPTIDPNRYWHNKSGGQVALGAIAGALFGFAGKGIDYLGVIQREIDRDVQAQVDTFNNRGRLLDKAQNNINSTYEQARQDGLSDQEARAKAYTATTASLGAYLNYVTQMNAAAASNAEIVNIRSQLPLTLVQAMEKGQAAALAAGEKASSIYLNGANARATLRNAETNAQNAETARIKVELKGGEGLKALPEVAQKKLNELNHQRLVEMKQAELSAGGFWDKIGQKAANIPGAGLVSAAAREQRKNAKIYSGNRLEEAKGMVGAIQSHDLPLIDAALPESRNALGEDAKSYHNAKVKQFENEMRAIVEKHGGHFDVKEWEQDLGGAGGGKGVPSEQEEGD